MENVDGKIKCLNSSLVAIESKLGWILMGIVFNNVYDKKTEDVTSAFAVTSLFTHTSKIENLWKLDLFCIQDPTCCVPWFTVTSTCILPCIWQQRIPLPLRLRACNMVQCCRAY